MPPPDEAAPDDLETSVQFATGDPKLAIAAVIVSADDGNVAANAIDGDLATRWSASGDGQWIRFDLGSNLRFSHLRIAPYNGINRVFSFDVQVSATGSTWTTVGAGLKTALNNSLQTFEFT